MTNGRTACTVLPCGLHLSDSPRMKSEHPMGSGNAPLQPPVFMDIRLYPEALPALVPEGVALELRHKFLLLPRQMLAWGLQHEPHRPHEKILDPRTRRTILQLYICMLRVGVAAPVQTRGQTAYSTKGLKEKHHLRWHPARISTSCNGWVVKEPMASLP